MKLPRGSKLFIGSEDDEAGPIKWTLVREWYALGIMSEYHEFRLADSSKWITVSECENFQTLPKNVANSDYYNSSERSRIPITRSQLTYADFMQIPFSVTHLDKNLLARFIVQWEEVFPDRIDANLRKACEQESQDSWKDLNATKKQLQYLGADEDSGITRGQASQLIAGEATEGQLRRLKYYGIALPENVSKSEASELIDSYVAQNPDEEPRYQVWKKQRNSEMPKPIKKRIPKKPFWAFWK